MMFFDYVLEETDKKDSVESAKYKINIFWPIRIRKISLIRVLLDPIPA